MASSSPHGGSRSRPAWRGTLARPPAELGQGIKFLPSAYLTATAPASIYTRSGSQSREGGVPDGDCAGVHEHGHLGVGALHRPHPLVEGDDVVPVHVRLGEIRLDLIQGEGHAQLAERRAHLHASEAHEKRSQTAGGRGVRSDTIERALREEGGRVLRAWCTRRGLPGTFELLQSGTS
eukprot:1184633-Prorocentrum_minimum.AAC.1